MAKLNTTILGCYASSTRCEICPRGRNLQPPAPHPRHRHAKPLRPRQRHTQPHKAPHPESQTHHRAIEGHVLWQYRDSVLRTRPKARLGRFALGGALVPVPAQTGRAVLSQASTSRSPASTTRCCDVCRSCTAQPRRRCDALPSCTGIIRWGGHVLPLPHAAPAVPDPVPAVPADRGPRCACARVAPTVAVAAVPGPLPDMPTRGRLRRAGPGHAPEPFAAHSSRPMAHGHTGHDATLPARRAQAWHRPEPVVFVLRPSLLGPWGPHPSASSSASSSYLRRPPGRSWRALVRGSRPLFGRLSGLETTKHGTLRVDWVPSGTDVAPHSPIHGPSFGLFAAKLCRFGLQYPMQPPAASRNVQRSLRRPLPISSAPSGNPQPALSTTFRATPRSLHRSRMSIRTPGNHRPGPRVRNDPSLPSAFRRIGRAPSRPCTIAPSLYIWEALWWRAVGGTSAGSTTPSVQFRLPWPTLPCDPPEASTGGSSSRANT